MYHTVKRIQQNYASSKSSFTVECLSRIVHQLGGNGGAVSSSEGFQRF